MSGTTYTLKEAVTIFKAAHLEYLRQRSTMPDTELQGICKNDRQKFNTTNGIPAIKIEVKNALTKDSLSKDQHKVKQQIEVAGGIYIIADSFNGFIEYWINEIENKNPCDSGKP